MKRDPIPIDPIGKIKAYLESGQYAQAYSLAKRCYKNEHPIHFNYDDKMVLATALRTGNRKEDAQLIHGLERDILASPHLQALVAIAKYKIILARCFISWREPTLARAALVCARNFMTEEFMDSYNHEVRCFEALGHHCKNSAQELKLE